MTHSTPKRRAWRVAAVATAGALVAALGFAAPASAAVLDPNAEGSITITKLVNPTETQPTNGLEATLTDANGEVLPGINFSIQKLDIDLSTTGGWAAVNTAIANLKLDPPVQPDIDSSFIEQDGDTGADGVIVFDELPVGAYLVTENLTPEQKESGITGAVPFIVTVPITNPVNRNAWVYDVYVYPKNFEDKPAKAVKDDELNTITVGDTIDWTITAPVPSQDSDAYSIVDPFVSNLFIPETVADNITLSIASTTLTEGDDYTFTYDPINADPAGDNVLTVTLTEDGLDVLNDAAFGTNVVLTVTTEVISVPANGVIDNQAFLFPNSSWPLDQPGIPTDEPESKFGEIRINKHVNGDTADRLAGAEFQVFLSEADAIAKTNPISINGVTTFGPTTATDDLVIGPLRASNWENGAEITTGLQNYWVLETKAPAGYELAPNAFEVSIDHNTGDGTDIAYADLDVPNVPKPELPLTGGTVATWLFFIVGGLVLAGGALLVVRARRQNA